jgi:hypothetical protein
MRRGLVQGTRITPDHGIEVDPSVDIQDVLSRENVKNPRGWGFRGRLDGGVSVACYCGRTTVVLSWPDVWRGIAPPACRTRECRDEERRRNPT